MNHVGLECREVAYAPPGDPAQAPAPILDGATASFVKGAPALVTGPMGAGKSTLLHILAGLLRPSRGEVLAEGRPVSRWTAAHRDLWRRSVGIALQASSLWPELTALENAMLPLIPRGKPLAALRTLGLEALESLGVSHLAGRSARLLSGGERQRVAVARALASRPAFLFLDEPTAHQDAEGVRRILGAVSSAVSWNATVVAASHDPRVAEAGLFQDLWRLTGGRLERIR
jgi:putative ABC transport system ATP-binding protein